MIDAENLNKMYEGVINNQELTTKELNSYGFNSKDLATLIEGGSLERIKRGHYSFKLVEDLYNYGKSLVSMQEYDKAKLCFEKCYELDPKHFGVCFQLFLRCIQDRDYEKAFEYFDHIFETDNKYYKKDINYYLYLLSLITELPEKYREYAKSLEFGDMIVDVNDKRYNDISAHNKIRLLSLKQRFKSAYKNLIDLTNQNDRLCIQDNITKTLLNEAITEQNITNQTVVKLINDKKYEEVIEYLEKIQNRHNLSKSSKYILSLVKDLTEIMKTGQIPEKQIFYTDSLSEAINGKNYELAFYLVLAHIKKFKVKANDDAVYLLLFEIKKLVDEKNKTVGIEQHEEQSQAIQTATVSTSSCNTFADIISYLMKSDLDNALITLRNYLESIGKKQYEFLIRDLIRISVLEKDTAFTKPMVALTFIVSNNFEFNIPEYIKDFYENLVQNNFDKARLYLDVISESNRLGHTCILTEGLEQALNNAENMSNYSKVEQPTIEQPQSVENKYTVTNDQKLLQSKEQSFSKSQTPQSNNKNEDYKFINKKLERLYKKGIVVLKPMRNEKMQDVFNIVKGLPDVVAFVIGSDNSRQIVLRYKPFIKEYLNFKKLHSLGDRAYSKGDYDTCISFFRKSLEFGNPKALVYAKLGLAYMKKFDKKTAIDYFTVATELSKNEDIRYDYTNLIIYLGGLAPEEDEKPCVKMLTTDFGNDIDEYYGTEEVEQVAELINSGMTFDDACLSVGLDEEQKNIVSLIFAKECYAQENYTMGDQFLKRVERSKNKTKFIKSLFEEVRKNKIFYKNRIEKGQKLLLVPNAKK